MTFPVSQSVLDADALAAELKRRYGFDGDVRCKLLSRGMNDIYRIEHAGGPHALKVSRSGKSNDDEFAYEQNYVNHLSTAGIEVPNAIPLADGSLFFSVEAPEGKRQIVMMRWLDGEPFGITTNEDDAHRLGVFLAEMHRAAANFSTLHRKTVASEPKLADRLPYLLDMVRDRPSDHAFLERAGATVLDRMLALDPKAVPSGACHGDMQCANVMQLASGGLAVFDFSDCGTDPLAKDIAAFYWRNDFEGRPESVNRAFVVGYDSARPLSPEEKAAQPLFRLLRHFLITSTMALYVNRIGPVPGFDKNIDFYIDMIRRYGEGAGIT
ncbi:MAG: phosphotransferase [Rhodospirillaceae bacterium]|jgi:Ser/Thr protein kinase RdoA (MazF antagonist)|nr:phosphotransferase [Rhodospirillaceae bacterium]MBT5565928.1 phosphotransferase [Rhodospirillaceae bacterium]MBT6088652.1 phosphotransferase [Rhodospirillaceae bacterium]MBT6961290.1 phosphotransferase [Rhodospirillaceae bacterium]MBT7450048.1 phosphotransferase [Rhodospirillaceae bacterium]